MAGPWEAYGPAPAAPWAAYGPPPAPPERPVEPNTFGGRVATGLGDAVQGGAQLLAHSLPSGVVGAVNDAAAWANRQPVLGPVTRGLGMVPATPQQIDQQVQQREGNYQAARRAAGSTGFDWGRMLGNVASALPAAAALPAGSGLLGAAAVGAGSNAALSLAEPVTDGGDYWAAKKEQAELGAVTGAVGGVAGRALGRLIAPSVTSQARALDEAGVSLTPGQIVGGMTRRLEDGATSIPVVGDAVRGAQRRGIETFNRATANEVLAPLGQSVMRDAPVGRALLEDVGQRVSAAYDAAVSRAQPFRPDAQFAQDIQGIAGQFLTPSSGQTFLRALQDRIVSRVGSGPIDGATYQTIKSDLGRLAADYSGPTATAAERELARAFVGVQDAFKGLLARTNPAIAPDLQAADAAYSRLLRMERAAGGVGAVEGVFSPAQLTGSVQRMANSPRQAARGNAVMQDLTDAARATMPSTVPDSGTPFRAMLGVGGANMAGLLDPTTAGASAGLLGLYTQPAQTAFQRFALAPRPMPLRVVGNTIASAPLAGAFAGGLLAP